MNDQLYKITSSLGFVFNEYETENQNTIIMAVCNEKEFSDRAKVLLSELGKRLQKVPIFGITKTGRAYCKYLSVYYNDQLYKIMTELIEQGY